MADLPLSIVLPVDFAPVSDLKHEDRKDSILDPHNDPVVADPITPESARRPLERFADPPRTLRASDAFLKESNNPTTVNGGELVNAALRARREFDAPIPTHSSIVHAVLFLELFK
jgi:hypothetical protein